MARPRRINQALVAQAQKVVAAATDVHQLRAAQAVLLPAGLGTSLETTGALLGVGRATVPRLQAHFGAEVSAKPPSRKVWGGRRHALLSLARRKRSLADGGPRRRVASWSSCRRCEWIWRRSWAGRWRQKFSIG